MVHMHPLQSSLQVHLDRLGQLGFDVRPLIFEAPATEAQVEALERELDCAIPPSFRYILCNVSSHVEFRWFAPSGHTFPPPFQSNFCGDLHWSLEFTSSFNRNRLGWIETVFPNPADPYDAVWHNKLPFLEVGNGDLIAIDLAPNTYERIVYLSHDDGAGHGYTLAENFAKLLERWVPLACPGGEDWQWLPFCESSTSAIDPDCQNALNWKQLLVPRNMHIET